METINKKTIGGIALAAILVGGMFTFFPQNASADLTFLDKFGTIIDILINIQNILLDPDFGLEEIKREVRNIEGNVTSPDFGLEEIKREVRGIEGNVTSPDFGLEEIKREVRNIEGNVTEINTDLLLKKRFYQFVNDTETVLTPSTVLVAEVRVVSCAPELQLADACAFNVESILLNATGTMDVLGPFVDGISNEYVATDDDVNFLVDAFKEVTLSNGNLTAIGPIGVIGASESVSILVFSPSSVITINKIEFNGEQPQGIELELVVRTEGFI